MRERYSNIDSTDQIQGCAHAWDGCKACWKRLTVGKKYKPRAKGNAEYRKTISLIKETERRWVNPMDEAATVADDPFAICMPCKELA
jgi:hypothetical protein